MLNYLLVIIYFLRKRSMQGWGAPFPSAKANKEPKKKKKKSN